jgi:general control protein GCN4
VTTSRNSSHRPRQSTEEGTLGSSPVASVVHPSNALGPHVLGRAGLVYQYPGPPRDRLVGPGLPVNMALSGQYCPSTSGIPDLLELTVIDYDLASFPPLEAATPLTDSSPAMTNVLDVEFDLPNHPITVSPQSLFLHDHNASAPNSSALTALTSPSLADESPAFSSCQISPDFGEIDFNNVATGWFPLFPTEDDALLLTGDTSHISEASLAESNGVATSTSNHSKSPSSFDSARRPSSVAGVSSRRRNKPLPPIIVEDHTDHVAMKRARNTIAARKSRERKAQRMEDLEGEIAKLIAERDYWRELAESRSEPRT